MFRQQFNMEINVCLIRNLIVVLICASFFTKVDLRGISGEEDRLGWKTSGNGYFKYKTSTSFRKTKQLMINGTFSTTPNNPNNNLIVAAEDNNGDSIFTYSVSHGVHYLSLRQLGSYQNISGITSGRVFNLALIFTETFEDDGNYLYNLTPLLEQESPLWSLGKIEKATWNLDDITLFIGGYKLTNETYFHGCLSDFVFDGVDIIETYFDEYPNNVNPTRGSMVIGNFSNVPELCQDINPSPEKSSTSSTTLQTSSATNSSIKPKSVKFLIQLLFCIVIFRIFE